MQVVINFLRLPLIHRSAYPTIGFGEFALHDDLWKAMVFHARNMTSPLELVFQDHGFGAGNLGLEAVSAGKSNVWCGGGGGASLPPLSLVFE